jgi:hypothetical protein
LVERKHFDAQARPEREEYLLKIQQINPSALPSDLAAEACGRPLNASRRF